MLNPFRLQWLKGWLFQLVLMEGDIKIEAHGFGVCLQTALEPGESPRSAADRLVLAEDKRRKSLHHSWIKKNPFISECCLSKKQTNSSDFLHQPNIIQVLEQFPL